MNKARRAELAKARELIERALGVLSEAKAIVEECRDDETAYLDAMPDSLRDGSKGDRAREVIDTLDDVVQVLDGVLDDDTAGKLEEAAQ